MIGKEVNIPIQIQPQIFCALCITCWCQILYYNHDYNLFKAILVGVVTAALMGGAELLFVLVVRIAYHRGIEWPGFLFGVIAAIVLILGLLPPYAELWKRRGRVIGISWFFLGADMLGAVFSLVSLVVEKTFDIFGGTLYILLFIMEAGICCSHIIWRLRNWELRKAAKAAGKSIDDMLESQERATPPITANDEVDPPTLTIVVEQVKTADLEAQRENIQQS